LAFAVDIIGDCVCFDLNLRFHTVQNSFRAVDFVAIVALRCPVKGSIASAMSHVNITIFYLIRQYYKQIRLCIEH
jgi:hypothetical protein